jgi:hypothetical protein
LPMKTWSSRNSINCSDTLQAVAANCVSRALISRQAICTAIPFKSVPADAAVGEVLGTLSVDVAVMRTRSRPMPNSSAAT